MPRGIFCQWPATDGILNHYSMPWTAQDSQTEPVTSRILKSSSTALYICTSALACAFYWKVLPGACSSATGPWNSPPSSEEPSIDSTSDRGCESTSALQGAVLFCPLLGEVLCIPASSLPWGPAEEHPGNLIKLSFCLGGKNIMTSGQKKQKG